MRRFRNAPVRAMIPSSGYAGAGDSFISGMNNIIKNYMAFVQDIEQDVLPQAMEYALRPTLELSNVYAPIDTGEMRGSGYVEVRKRGRGGPTAEIGYGKGGQAPYAVLVHEKPEFYHTPPTQYKFLQRAMDEDTNDILQRVAQFTMQRTRA